MQQFGAANEVSLSMEMHHTIVRLKPPSAAVSCVYRIRPATVHISKRLSQAWGKHPDAKVSPAALNKLPAHGWQNQLHVT